MAPGGNAPKHNRQRPGREPLRGEWVRLDPMPHPVIPELDEFPTPTCTDLTKKVHEGWHFRTYRLWTSWRTDPVTATWTDSDLEYALDTAYLHSEAAWGGRGAQPAELRLRMESLGLTPKGRVDRRFLLPDEKVPTVEGDAESPTSQGTGSDLPEAI